MTFWTSKSMIGSWKLTEVVKMKHHLLFCREFSKLCIEDWPLYCCWPCHLIEAAIEDSAFWWLLCLNHNVLRTVNSLTINLLGCVWFGLGIQFCISNTCGGVWLTGVGKNKETDKEHDENCIEFSFFLNLNRHWSRITVIRITATVLERKC